MGFQLVHVRLTDEQKGRFDRLRESIPTHKRGTQQAMLAAAVVEWMDREELKRAERSATLEKTRRERPWNM